MRNDKVSHLAAFTPDEVRKIRRQAKTMTNAAIARLWGASKTAISFIVRRITYDGVR